VQPATPATPSALYNRNMIIQATEEDGPRIEGLAVGADVFSEEEIEALGAVWEEFVILGAEESGYEFLVEREGDSILGFACYGRRDLTDGVFDLYYLVVEPAARRHGAGRRLLAASEQAARHAGARMMLAEVSGNPECEPIQAFYRQTGYAVEATIKDFFKVGDDLEIFIKRF
jgi:ribosomal protein S18 acetylase RimI-like enzyme